MRYTLYTKVINIIKYLSIHCPRFAWGEAEEEENRWEQVQELKKMLRIKKSKHWDVVMRVIRARENTENDIDNFLRAFVETIPQLLEK